LAVFASDVQYLDSTRSDLKLISSFHYWLSLRLYEEKLKGIQEENLYAIFTCGIIHIMMVIRCVILDVTAGIDMLNGFDNVLVGVKSINSFLAYAVLPDMVLISSPSSPVPKYWILV
jgi:hypothetical protein